MGFASELSMSGEVHVFNWILRFFRNELSWNQEKVDDLLLPIIRKMGQRSQVRPHFILVMRHVYASTSGKCNEQARLT